MNISEWKALEPEQMSSLLRDSNKFNAYSDAAYSLLNSLAKEYVLRSQLKVVETEILNRWGELIIHLKVAGKEFAHDCGEERYYGFRIWKTSIDDEGEKRDQ